jgi:hypothetical protein
VGLIRRTKRYPVRASFREKGKGWQEEEASGVAEGTGPRGKSFDAGEGPQLLAQLQATGAEVVGSDGEKVGDLKEVRDADFRVGRGGLKRDVYVPVRSISEVSEDGRIVLDVASGEVDDQGWDKAFPLPGSVAISDASDFSDHAKEADSKKPQGEGIIGFQEGPEDTQKGPRGKDYPGPRG